MQAIRAKTAATTFFAALVALLLIGGIAFAASPVVGVRTGDHPGYGRVVLDLPAGTAAVPQEQDGRLVVRFDPAATARAGAALPRNVRGITAVDAGVEIAFVPGAQVRIARVDGKLVVDVLDGAPARTNPAPPAPKPPAALAPTVTAAKLPLLRISPPIDRHDDGAPPPSATAAQPATPPAAVASAEPQPQTADWLVLPPDAAVAPADPAPPLVVGNIVTEAVLSLAAKPQPAPSGGPGHSIALPFDPGVGAAAFRRGGSAIVVFDERRPIDTSALRGDPIFAAAKVQLLPGATILRFPLPASDELRLTRAEHGWMVTAAAPVGGTFSLRPIRPEPAGGSVRLRADDAGQVVSMPDPDTGDVLLIGTQRQPGQAVAVARTAPQYALLPTWQGVAVEPVSDRLTLHVAAPGFVLTLGASGQISLAAAPDATVAVADADLFSRRYDFPSLPLEGLRWRLQSATVAASAAPARDRGPARIAVAKAMLALGMDAEAQSVLTVAAADDGRLADDPSAIGLQAISALLAGRTDGIEKLDDARLSGTDEIALWRAAAAAMRDEGSPQAAPVFAAELPLLLSYPEPLRDRLLPLAAETMALGGERAAARKLVDGQAADHALDLARAILLQQDAQAQGADPRPALDLYDALAQSPDRLVRARAAARAVELRLAGGALTLVQAADALDKLLYAWRDNARELMLRQRVAELRRQAGQWRPALAMLRETAELWSEQKPILRARMADLFAEAIAHDAAAPLPPLELVTLVEENTDLLPEADAGQALAARLADRLVTLDLPQRAVPLLEKLAASASAGPARAAFGDRLARMRLAQGDATGALAALSASDAQGLPPPLLEARTLTFARAAAANGELPRATAALAALGSVGADSLRADLLEAAKDWPAAEAALRDFAAKTVPADGPLDEAAARTLLRFASAAAGSGDDQTLAQLREHDTKRLPQGKLAEMFRLITASPVQGVADLPRAIQESKLAGGLPVALKALAP